MTPADLERYAVYNHRAGWSQPTVRKDYINGIPALVENAVITHNNLRSVGMTLWIADKTFQVRLTYDRIPGIVDCVNETISSIRIGPRGYAVIPTKSSEDLERAYRQGYIDGSQLAGGGASL